MISGADAPMLNAKRPFNSTSPELSYSPHLYGKATADPAENESYHYGLANSCISAKVSRRVFGRVFSV